MKKFTAALLAVLLTSSFAAGSGLSAYGAEADGNEVISDISGEDYFRSEDGELLAERIELLAEENCSCSADKAGIYTTKGVTDSLNIRAEHNTSSKVLGQIPAGAKFTVTKASDTWAHVEYNGIKGYSSVTYIQKTADLDCGCSADKAGTYTTKGVTDSLNIREEHSTSSKVLGQIPAGAKFTVTKAGASWAHVEYNGVKGLVSVTYIQKVSTEETCTCSTGRAGTYTTKGVTDYLNIRESHSTSSKSIGQIPAGAKFTVTKASDAWAHVEYNNVKGIVSASFIQKVTAEETCSCSADKKGTYTTKNVTDYLNIREAHDGSSKSLGKIPSGAKFTVTKLSDKWAHVEYNGISGIVVADYIQPADGKIISGKISVPDEEYKAGTVFRVDGAISSVFPLKKVWGGIYDSSGNPTEQFAEEEVSSSLFDFSSFNGRVRLELLPEGSYTYKLMCDDSDGNRFVICEKAINVVLDEYLGVAGDINGNGIIDVGDLVKLMRYLQKGDSLTKLQYTAADINGDKKSDVFDAVELRKLLVGELSRPESVSLNVMKFNQNPDYPTGCESAALYILLKYYNTNVTMSQITEAIPKGPVPYLYEGLYYGADPEREFVGEPTSAYSYGVFNDPIASTAEKFRKGVSTQYGAPLTDVIRLLDDGVPVIAWYTMNPDKPIEYKSSWFDQKTGRLIVWPGGEHAVVVCGHDSENISFSDPYTGTIKTVKKSDFQKYYDRMGGRIVYYRS